MDGFLTGDMIAGHSRSQKREIGATSPTLQSEAKVATTPEPCSVIQQQSVAPYSSTVGHESVNPTLRFFVKQVCLSAQQCFVSYLEGKSGVVASKAQVVADGHLWLDVRYDLWRR